jgi:hypothetical protein
MSFIVKENTENKESLENVKETLEIPKESLEPEQEEKKDNNNIEEPLKKQRKPKTEKQLAALARGREKAAEGKLRKREELTQMKLQLHELQTFKQRVLNDRKTKTQQQEQPSPAPKLVRQQSGQYQQPRQEQPRQEQQQQQQSRQQQQPRQQQRIPEHIKLGMSLNEYRLKLAMDKKYGVI